MCRIFTESPLQATVGDGLSRTIHNVAFMRETWDLVKVGFFNVQKVQTMIRDGIGLAVLREKRRNMTRGEFRRYLRNTVGITRAQGQLEKAFNLV